MTAMNEDVVRWRALLIDLIVEMMLGRTKHGPMLSVYDGWARLLGEVDELRTEVYGRHPDRDNRIRDEAWQVAAMAVRLALTAGAQGHTEPRSPELAALVDGLFRSDPLPMPPVQKRIFDSDA